MISDNLDDHWKEKHLGKYGVLFERVFLQSLRMSNNEFIDREYEKYQKEIDLHTFERPIRSDIFRKSWDQMGEKKWHTRHNKGEEIHELM